MDNEQDETASNQQGGWHAEQQRMDWDAFMRQPEEVRAAYWRANPPDTHSPRTGSDQFSAMRDTAPDGRPLMVATSNGPQMYEIYCKPQRDE